MLNTNRLYRLDSRGKLFVMALRSAEGALHMALKDLLPCTPSASMQALVLHVTDAEEDTEDAEPCRLRTVQSPNKMYLSTIRN